MSRFFIAMESGSISSGGVRIYYESVGQGAPLMILNGGPGLPHEYLQELKALAPYARLIFYDQRGTGKSDRADPATYTIEANVQDLENLRAALGLERTQVLGHSWGGMLAQAYVCRYPERVTKLILADTLSSIDDLNVTLERMLDAVPRETRETIERYERKGIYAYGGAYPPEYQAALDVAYEPVGMSIPPPEYLQHTFARLSYEVYKEMWGQESEFRVTGTLREFDARDCLGTIRAPTLVIVGASDMPTVAMAEQTARAIPNARLEVFEHSRHYPFLEEPEKFQRVVGAFLQE